MIATHHDLRRLQLKDRRLRSVMLNFSCKKSRRDLDHESRSELQTQLKRNNILESVAIYMDDSFDPQEIISLDEYTSVLEDIGRLPRLKKLFIGSSSMSKGHMPVQVLTTLMKFATILETLTITDLDVTGSSEEFDLLALQVQRLWYLRYFSMKECQLSLQIPSTSSVCPLDPLLLSLTVLPSLNTLHLVNKEDCLTRLCSPSAISSIFFSTSIRRVKLQNLGLSDEHLISLACVLQRNEDLRWLEMGPFQHLKPVAAHALSQALRSNIRLSHLELIVSQMIQDESATLIANALQVNRGLRKFALTGSSKIRLGRLSKTCRTSFLEAAQWNYQLNELTVFRKSTFKKAFERYIQLNALGLGSLLLNNQATCEDWIQRLASPGVGQDVDAIFYFLSQNPSLCAQAATVPCSSTTAKKRKRTRSPCHPVVRRSKRLCFLKGCQTAS
jgi:hypothetical protein